MSSLSPTLARLPFESQELEEEQAARELIKVEISRLRNELGMRHVVRHTHFLGRRIITVRTVRVM